MWNTVAWLGTHRDFRSLLQDIVEAAALAVLHDDQRRVGAHACTSTPRGSHFKAQSLAHAVACRQQQCSALGTQSATHPPGGVHALGDSSPPGQHSAQMLLCLAEALLGNSTPDSLLLALRSPGGHLVKHAASSA